MIFTETYFIFFKAILSELGLIEAGAYFWHLRLEGFLKVGASYASEGSVVSNPCILNEMVKRRKSGWNHLFMPFHSHIIALSKAYTRYIFYL